MVSLFEGCSLSDDLGGVFFDDDSAYESCYSVMEFKKDFSCYFPSLDYRLLDCRRNPTVFLNVQCSPIFKRVHDYTEVESSIDWRILLQNKDAQIFHLTSILGFMTSHNLFT